MSTHQDSLAYLDDNVPGLDSTEWPRGITAVTPTFFDPFIPCDVGCTVGFFGTGVGSGLTFVELSHGGKPGLEFELLGLLGLFGLFGWWWPWLPFIPRGLVGDLLRTLRGLGVRSSSSAATGISSMNETRSGLTRLLLLDDSNKFSASRLMSNAIPPFFGVFGDARKSSRWWGWWPPPPRVSLSPSTDSCWWWCPRDCSSSSSKLLFGRIDIPGVVVVVVMAVVESSFSSGTGSLESSSDRSFGNSSDVNRVRTLAPLNIDPLRGEVTVGSEMRGDEGGARCHSLREISVPSSSIRGSLNDMISPPDCPRFSPDVACLGLRDCVISVSLSGIAAASIVVTVVLWPTLISSLGCKLDRD